MIPYGPQVREAASRERAELEDQLAAVQQAVGMAAEKIAESNQTSAEFQQESAKFQQEGERLKEKLAMTRQMYEESVAVVSSSQEVRCMPKTCTLLA